MDTSALVAARDKLNADIGTLLAATTVDQPTIDALTAEVTATDADVQKAIAPPPPPPPPPPSLDFTAFDAAVVAFKADLNINQATVDSATAAIKTATI